MVRLKGQLLSLDASGSIGKTVTYSNWKGRGYAKKYSVPTDNHQPGHLGMRAAMGFLSTQWSGLATADKDTWNSTAVDEQISEFDAYVGFNLLRTVETNAPTKAQPPTPATFAPGTVGFTVTPKSSFVDVQFGFVPTPVTWSMTIFRSDVNAFTPSLANMVHQVTGVVLPTLNHIRDVPPNRGTWYYRWQSGDAFGNKHLHFVQGEANWT